MRGPEAIFFANVMSKSQKGRFQREDEYTSIIHIYKKFTTSHIIKIGNPTIFTSFFKRLMKDRIPITFENAMFFLFTIHHFSVL